MGKFLQISANLGINDRQGMRESIVFIDLMDYTSVLFTRVMYL